MKLYRKLVKRLISGYKLEFMSCNDFGTLRSAFSLGIEIILGDKLILIV